MQLTARNGQRGQALTETAAFLPLFLLLLFGMMWVIQFSVVNERAQISVRYSGLISNEASPYDGYSLYAIYNNIGGLSQSATTTCATPPPDAFTNDPSNGAFPGPTSQPFWQPDQASTGTCSTGRIELTGNSLLVPALLVNTYSTVTASKRVTDSLPAAIQGLQNNTLNATQNFFNTPDIASLIQCYPQLQSALSASLVAETSASQATAATAPLGAITPVTNLSLTAC